MQLIFDGNESTDQLLVGAAMLNMLVRMRTGQPLSPASGDLPPPASDGGDDDADHGPVDDAGGESTAPPAPGKRRGRKTNAERAAAEAAQRAAETPPAQQAVSPDKPPEQPAAPSKEQIRAALQSVVDVPSLGTQAGIDALKAFQKADGTPCEALRDLQPEQYPAFIAHCQGLVKRATMLEG